jgi:hypothetical protein
MISSGLHDTHRRTLIRATMDAYRDWCQECSAASAAYRCWAHAAEPEWQEAWQVYDAALDREQRASSLYADLVAQVAELDSRHCWHDHAA